MPRGLILGQELHISKYLIQLLTLPNRIQIGVEGYVGTYLGRYSYSVLLERVVPRWDSKWIHRIHLRYQGIHTYVLDHSYVKYVTEKFQHPRFCRLPFHQ